jgi:hypothetical protein
MLVSSCACGLAKKKILRCTKVYRNRETLAFCRCLNIVGLRAVVADRLSRPAPIGVTARKNAASRNPPHIDPSDAHKPHPKQRLCHGLTVRVTSSTTNDVCSSKSSAPFMKIWMVLPMYPLRSKVCC